MFVRNAWYVAAPKDEVGRQPLGRLLLGEPVVMFRREDGTAVALEDRCAHRRAPLSKGKIVGDTIQCGYHGLQYDSTGACVLCPDQPMVPPGTRVKSYPLTELHGYLWIWMGAARPDTSRIADLHENDSPDWTVARGYTHIAGHYQLLVDNLLDLSHLAYVHKTIGTSADVNPTLKLEYSDRHVQLARTILDLPPAPIYKTQGFINHLDQTKLITFMPPSNVTIAISTAERREGGKKTVQIVINAVTPETETSSHYFWTSARDYERHDPQFTEYMRTTVGEAFDEDKDMIEAQQRNIAREPAAGTVDLRQDAGALQARKIVERMLAEERARAQAAE
jgi:phenylpropionate dioxygenase-like ring-hydroxylating dioxygenase large terminal subunit